MPSFIKIKKAVHWMKKMDFFVLLFLTLLTLRQSTVEAPRAATTAGRYGKGATGTLRERFFTTFGVRKSTSLQDDKCDILLSLFKAAADPAVRNCRVRFFLSDQFHDVMAERPEGYHIPREHTPDFHFPQTRKPFSLTSYSMTYNERSKDLLVEVEGPIVGGRFHIPTSEKGCQKLISDILPEGKSAESLKKSGVRGESLKSCKAKWKDWLVYTSYEKAVLVSPEIEKWAFYKQEWALPSGWLSPPSQLQRQESRAATRLQDDKCDIVLRLFKAAAAAAEARKCHVKFIEDDQFHDVMAERPEGYHLPRELTPDFHFPQTQNAFSLTSYSMKYIEWSKNLLVIVKGPIVGGKFYIPTSEKGCQKLISDILPKGKSAESLKEWLPEESLESCTAKWNDWLLSTSFGKAVLVSPENEKWAFYEQQWALPSTWF